jgi:folylpolyglutamate synthase
MRQTGDIDNLNVVHVAGTKGKGSTCAFTESFLRVYGRRTGYPRKTGLYTSPHLIYPEERIRINSQPIARDLFAKYFFQVWDALVNAAADGEQGLPRYLQLCLLVSFHAFIQEGVEAAIIETHHGGEYDATNVIEHPAVTVVTPLGMDHVQQLGPTIENIAWHKSGIFKHGAHALSATQEEKSTIQVLRNRGAEKGVLSLNFAEETDPFLPADAVQLQPRVQRANAALALAAARSFVEVTAPEAAEPLSEKDVEQGVEQFAWPGRFQRIAEGPFDWFLDSAHNEMSVVKAAEWFIENSRHRQGAIPRILIFSQISEHRDGTLVLERLASTLCSIDIHHVIFTQYSPQQDFDSTAAMITKLQDHESHEAFAEIWKRLHKESRILYEPNIRDALESAKRIGQDAEGGGMQTLITGSQHLVGGALFSLGHLSSGRETAPP